MAKELFGPMELDALGEMMNISLGSSATAVSNMLEHRVDITTPKVTVVDVKDFVIGNLDPAMGVEIKYVEGLDGSNIMLLRRSDVKVIVDILMGAETAEDEFELNELTVSAVCEVMNQMMGAAATAMSDFLGFPVNISTPEPFELNDLEDFKRDHLPSNAETIVVVRFSLKIENALESEFMNVMSVGLAKELLHGLGLESEEWEEEPTPEPAPEPEPEPEPAPAPEPAAAQADGDSGRKLSQEEIEQMMFGNMFDEPDEPEPAPADSGKKLSQEEIEQMMAGMAPAPEPEPAPAADSGQKLSQEEIEKMMAGMGSGQTAAPAPEANQAAAPGGTPGGMPGGMPGAAQAAPPYGMPPYGMPPMGEGQQPMMPPYGYPPMPTGDGQNPYYPYPMYYGYPYPPQPPQQQPPEPTPPPEPKVIPTKPVEMQEMDLMASLGKEQTENLELIMEVPLQVTVEIGRTQRKVQDVLEFSKGSLVVLDKLAGDQVDLFVNGKCIAKGDVVVIDDNFGVRITEIVQKAGLDGMEPPKK